MNSVSFGAAPVVSTVARKAKMSRVIPSIKEKLNVEFGDYIYKARSMGSECKLEMENIIEAFKALCKKYKVNFDDYMGVFFRQLSP